MCVNNGRRGGGKIRAADHNELYIYMAGIRFGHLGFASSPS
jgi:hypothetical protein